MHLPEQVLHMFQVFAPSCVLLRQEILNDIAEALDADTQSVKRHLRPVAHRASMKLTSCHPTLEREMLENGSARPDMRCAQRQRFAPLLPFFTIEFFERRLSFVFLLAFALLQDFKQALAGR